MATHFADRLIQSVRKLGHPLCLGLDPHLESIPAPFRSGSMQPRDERTAPAVASFLGAVLERSAGRVALVKPQIAFFEQLGWRGIQVLGQLVEQARAQGLLVLLDAKRGDVASSADAYARAYLEPDGALPVDALTVNPYQGSDALAPFVARARDHGRGVFVLVATSNPGSRELQDRALEGGRSVAETVAAALRSACDGLLGPATGWSSLGAVVGATRAESADAIRAALPRALFLVPGFGAQGGSARDAVRGFAAGPSGLEGGVVNASRSILFAAGARADGDASSWERAFDARLAHAVHALAEAVQN